MEKQTQPLSISELKEFQQLSKKLFGEHKFVCFSKEEKQSPEYKSYDAYMSRIMECKNHGVPCVKGQPVIS